MAQQSTSDLYSLLYRFQFEDGSNKDFEIKLDSETLELRLDSGRPRPEWAKLKFHQCENCPLDSSVEYCPVALNLASLVESFQDSISYEKTDVTVITKEREYKKKKTLQKGLSALIGIYMVTSNCPIMDKLRPMVRFHLPFATSNETIYRAVSMYLVSQFFVMRSGGHPDWDLKRLSDIYKAISFVNKGMSQRVSNASNKDANVNAVVILHSLGDSVPFVIENGLVEIEYLFREYLRETGGLHFSPDNSNPH